MVALIYLGVLLIALIIGIILQRQRDKKWCPISKSEYPSWVVNKFLRSGKTYLRGKHFKYRIITVLSADKKVESIDCIERKRILKRCKR